MHDIVLKLYILYIMRDKIMLLFNPVWLLSLQTCLYFFKHYALTFYEKMLRLSCWDVHFHKSNKHQDRAANGGGILHSE